MIRQLVKVHYIFWLLVGFWDLGPSLVAEAES